MFYENRQQTGNRRTICLTEQGMFNLGTAHLWGSCSVLTPPPGIQTRRSEGTHTAAIKLDVNRPQHDERGASPAGSVERICLPMQGHRFNPWSRKILHTTRQLSLCATTTEACTPQSPGSATREATAVRSPVHCNEE